jgi:serine/threonine-protein kinase
VFLALSGKVLLLRRVPFDKPPAVLADQAASILRQAGYSDPPADRASGFYHNHDYLRWVREHDRTVERWRGLEDGSAPAIVFWYRQHNRHMSSFDPLDGPGVSPTDPPFLYSGMAEVSLDSRGHLLDLYVVPPELDSTRAESPPVDWTPFFTRAGLDATLFAPTPPAWVPPVYCDTRQAWIGTDPQRPDRPLRVEVGSYAGKPNYFQIVTPWSRPSRMQPSQLKTGEKLAQGVATVLILALLVGAVLLARRSLCTGHGDRRGAKRLAYFVLGSTLLSWALVENHNANPNTEWRAFVPFLGFSLFLAGMFWVLYLGLEPVVRRRWPDSLIGWNRFLAGRWRDPRVGRDLLLGMCVGTVVLVLEWLQDLAPGWLGRPPAQPDAVSLESLRGFAASTSQFLSLSVDVVFLPMAMLMLLLLFRMMLRKPRIAAAAVVLVLSLISSPGSDNFWLVLAMNVVQISLLLGLLLRFGVLACIAANFLTNLIGQYYPVTSDFSVWYAPATIFAFGVLIALALYAFRTSLAEQPAFRGRLMVD